MKNYQILTSHKYGPKFVQHSWDISGVVLTVIALYQLGYQACILFEMIKMALNIACGTEIRMRKIILTNASETLSSTGHVVSLIVSR